MFSVLPSCILINKDFNIDKVHFWYFILMECWFVTVYTPWLGSKKRVGGRRLCAKNSWLWPDKKHPTKQWLLQEKNRCKLHCLSITNFQIIQMCALYCKHLPKNLVILYFCSCVACCFVLFLICKFINTVIICSNLFSWLMSDLQILNLCL